MRNAICAVIAPSFTKAKNALPTPLRTLLVEALIVAVIAATTFDAKNTVPAQVLCAAVIQSKTENLNVIALAIPCVFLSLSRMLLAKSVVDVTITALKNANNIVLVVLPPSQTELSSIKTIG